MMTSLTAHAKHEYMRVDDVVLWRGVECKVLMFGHARAMKRATLMSTLLACVIMKT